jgi:hypothetical protein
MNIEFNFSIRPKNYVLEKNAIEPQTKLCNDVSELIQLMNV